MDNGAWVTFHYDFSGFALFDREAELEARRYADENHMEVAFVPFGRDSRQYLLSR